MNIIRAHNIRRYMILTKSFLTGVWYDHLNVYLNEGERFTNVITI